MSQFTALDHAWWVFNGSTADLRLAGTHAKAPLLDPASQNNDFTVAGMFSPNSVGSSVAGGIISKWKTTGDKRSWQVRQFEDDLEFRISQDGTTTPVSEIKALASLAASTKAFFCARYDWVSDGASLMDLQVNDTTVTQVTDAHGPVYSSTSADALVSAYDDSSVVRLAGNQYWVAYWNRRLSDSEVQKLRAGTVTVESLNPDLFIDFHQAVGSTYTAELPRADHRGTIPFTVEGTCVARSIYDSFVYDGSDDYHYMLGTDPNAPNFDPSSHGNDFSVAGEVMPLASVSAAKVIFGKIANVYRTWAFYQTTGGAFGFQVSKDATGAASTSITAAAVSVGSKQFFCARYDYVADNTSQMFLRVDDTTAQSTTARGPAYSSTSAPVRIGAFDSGLWNGRAYWLAYWKRKLTDAEVLQLRYKLKTPQELSCDFYIAFVGKDPTAASITSDVPAGTYTFTRNGGPAYVLGSLLKVDNQLSIPGEEPSAWMNRLGGPLRAAASSLVEQTRPRALSVLQTPPGALDEEAIAVGLQARGLSLESQERPRELAALVGDGSAYYKKEH